MINRINDHLCNKVSMYCSFHRVRWWSFDVTILLRILRDYQEQDSTKKLIWETSKNDQHFDQHWQSTMKIMNEMIWTSVRTIMNNIMNQLILQWSYKHRHDWQKKDNSAKNEESIQSKKIFSRKEKSISIQRDAEMLQLWKIWTS